MGTTQDHLADSAGPMAAVRLRAITKRFPSGLEAIRQIDMDIQAGQFVSIVGPSGCGKSTLLRIVAGLTAPSGGACIAQEGATRAFVFQEPALLPWRTVAGNAELLMELEHVGLAERRRRATESLQLVGLDGFADTYPHRLSGGMRMRLSLARALALRPSLLLLDEPFGALDELTRDVLQEELARLWQMVGFTALLVTHNVQEAVYLSNQVVVMSARPGIILDRIQVPFPFPRSPELRATGEFAALAGRVSATLRGEYADAPA